MTRADAIEKRVRLVVAAEEDVLSVVDALAGLAIEKGRRTSAKARTSFDNDHALAGVSESDSRAETREARADDDDVGGECGHAISEPRGRIALATRCERRAGPARGAARESPQ